MDLFFEVLAPFLPVLGEHRLTGDSRLRDFGLDSARAMDLLFHIEDTFDITLPDEDLNDQIFETVGSLWRAVSMALDAKSAL